jgi:Abortive infection alpha
MIDPEKIKDLVPIKEVYEDLAKPSAQKVGKAIGDIIGFLILPTIILRALNEKAEIKYKDHVRKFAEKLAEIPEENICPVVPEIGVKILERLSYTTSEEIAELFLNLLTRGSDERTQAEAHPAFIEIIDALSADEAKIISYLGEYKGTDYIPFLEIRSEEVKNGRKEYDVYEKNLSGLEKNVELTYLKNINTYLDNLERMGILRRKEGISLVEKSAYSNLEEQYSQLLGSYTEKNPGKNVNFKKSVYEITAFGTQFIHACTQYK